MPKPSDLAAAIIVSNGFNKFHLAIAAEELYRRGLLARLITGAYPTLAIQRLVRLPVLSRFPKAGRLERRAQDIPDELISPQFLADMVFQLAIWLRRLQPMQWLSAVLDVFSFHLYARFAAGIVSRAPKRVRIYHYRAGFGESSVPIARKKGMIALCDHSIAHPALVEYLVAHDGHFPPGPIEPETRLWRAVDADIRQADHVLVNSDFVRDMFLRMGWDAALIHVIYLGVDDAFIAAIDPDAHKRIGAAVGDLRLLFAGSFEPRKGADILIAALESLTDVDWRLDIAGSIDAKIRSTHSRFFADKRVRMLGTLSRVDLAREMSATEVFVFPSLAEGSARVVFEALAAGCYVITTPNSGSIVEDGVHGSVVPPGDVPALAAALRRAGGDRSTLARIGSANAGLVRRCFRQSDYGDALVKLYGSMLTGTCK